MSKAAKWVFVLLVGSVLFFSCKVNLNKAGRQLSSGLVGGAADKADSLTAMLITGARDSLMSPTALRKISALIDTLGWSLTGVMDHAIDSLLLRVTKVVGITDSIVESLTGQTMQKNLAELQQTLVGRTTEEIQSLMLTAKEILGSMGSDSTIRQIGKLRDQLIGKDTRTEIVSLVSEVMDTVTSKLNRQVNKVKDDVNEEIGFLSKHAGKLLLLVGAIALAIIGFVWFQRRRYLKIMRVLTKNIYSMEDETAYKSIKKSIKSDALMGGVESHLRWYLDSNGMLDRGKPKGESEPK